MSNKYPHSFRYDGPPIKVHYPFSISPSDANQNVIKQTPEEIIMEIDYPNGFGMRVTTRAGSNLVESTHPIVKKNGEYTIEM